MPMRAKITAPESSKNWLWCSFKNAISLKYMDTEMGAMAIRKFKDEAGAKEAYNQMLKNASVRLDI